MRLNTLQIMPAFLVAVFMGLPAIADDGGTLRLTGSSTVAPVIQEISVAYAETGDGLRVFVETGGSSKGITDLRNGLSDIAMVSRELKADETDLTAHTFARDGIATLVHGENNIDALTKEQLVSIFTGEVSNWSAFGGNDQEIIVISKGEGSATSVVLNEFLGITPDQIDADLIAAENAQMIKTVSLTVGGIGYVSIGAATVEMEYGAPVKMIGLGEIAPTIQNVSAGTYEATRPLSLVTMGELNGVASGLIEFAKSEAARDTIIGLNYVQVSD